MTEKKRYSIANELAIENQFLIFMAFLLCGTGIGSWKPNQLLLIILVILKKRL